MHLKIKSFFELVLGFWLLLRSVKCSSERKFFVYEWPDDIVTGWPLKYEHKRLSFSPTCRENNGLGTVLDAAQGLFRTHQYSLFEIFYRRLLEHPLRVTNPEDASYFFIPYDIGMDATTSREDGRLMRTNCPRLTEVLPLLEASPYFVKKGGLDHFVLTSINQPMDYFLTRTCSELYETCFNCTKLCIDTYPAKMFNELKRNAIRTHKWYSVPFPSNFHFGADVTRLPWDDAADSSRTPRIREHLVSFMGSARITATRCKHLRLAIMKECRRRPDRECLLVPLPSHSSLTQADTVGAYSRSRLCLMPGGDFPTRKGVLDALFLGCVPVLFQRTSGLNQWYWHWRGAARNATVFVPLEAFVNNPAHEMTRLLEIAADDNFVAARRQAFKSVAFSMQYSQLGAGRVYRDAVDVVLENL